jgi:hypothetical protein
MLLSSDTKDLTFTSDGDFMIDQQTGQLSLSTMDDMGLLCETIYRRLNSVDGDWGYTQHIASNVREAVGLQLNNSNIDYISFLIRRSLTVDNLLSPQEIVVVPGVAVDTKVTLSVLVRSESLKEDIMIGLIYDTRDNNFEVKFLNEKAYK